MNQRDEVVRYLNKVDFNAMCARDLLNGFYEQLQETMKHEKDMEKLRLTAALAEHKAAIAKDRLREMVTDFLMEFNEKSEPLKLFLDRYRQ